MGPGWLLLALDHVPEMGRPPTAQSLSKTSKQMRNYIFPYLFIFFLLSPVGLLHLGVSSGSARPGNMHGPGPGRTQARPGLGSSKVWAVPGSAKGGPGPPG